MKKLLKLTLIILLAITLLFAVTGCGNKKEESEKEETKTETEEISNGKSKTYNAFSTIKDNYLITVEGKMDSEDEENSTITMAVKGKNIYMDSKSSGQHATMIYKDNTVYIISHDEEAYIAMAGEENEMDGMTLMTEEDINKMEEAEYKTGNETINGTEYYYEEYTDEEENTAERYYFSGAELKYVKTIDENGEESLLKVIEFTSEVDDKLFEIPANYTKMDF